LATCDKLTGNQEPKWKSWLQGSLEFSTGEGGGPRIILSLPVPSVDAMEIRVMPRATAG